MAVEEDNGAKRPDIRRQGIGTRRRLDLEKKSTTVSTSFVEYDEDVCHLSSL